LFAVKKFTATTIFVNVSNHLKSEFFWL